MLPGLHVSCRQGSSLSMCEEGARVEPLPRTESGKDVKAHWAKEYFNVLQLFMLFIQNLPEMQRNELSIKG